MVYKQYRWGQGHFGASRGGSRRHKGLDIVAAYGQDVLSPIEGRVIRKSYPYANDLSYSGVLIEGTKGHSDLSVKIFYMSPPNTIMGKGVEAGDVIGKAQSLLTKYPGIINHIHLEIKRNGSIIDPKLLLPDIS